MNRRGMTLLEITVVLAILSILAAFSLTAFRLLGANSTPQAAANRLSGALAFARDRAAERSTDVYLIVYPARDSSVAGNTFGSKGAFFVYEDKLLTFRTAGVLNYGNFLPPSNVTGPLNEGVLHEEVYLDLFPQKTVQFGATGLAFDAPFAGIASGDCSFCTGAGVNRRGAILFHADGTAEFLDAAGATVASFGNTTVARAASLGLVSTDNTRQYLFAVGSAVSNIGLQASK